MTLWRGGVRPYDQGRTDLAAASHPIQVGIGHAGCTVSVQEADTTFRVYHGGRLLTEVLRTTTKQIARFKARSPGHHGNAYGEPQAVRRPCSPA